MNFAKLAIVGAIATQATALQVSGPANPAETTPQKIQDVIDVHDMVTRIYQDAMQQTISKIYAKHDSDDSKQLSKQEALEFFYHVLGVVNQDKELAIAQYAADLANMDKEAEISHDDMEHFIVNLFTGQYDDHKYKAANESGYIN